MLYMKYMHEIDYLDVDGHLLETFIAVHEDCSVTRAAIRLATNQSTVSHRLDRLREIVGDPLFVRAGRGIAPTSRADDIAPTVRAMLSQLQSLTAPPTFRVDTMRERIVIAATDYERGLFVMETAKQMMQQAPLARFDVIWDPYDSGDALRQGVCDVALAPTIARKTSELFCRPLFTDQFHCYYDPRIRSAPATLDDYIASRHVRVLFSASYSSPVDKGLETLARRRTIASELPSLNELPLLLRGTDLIATLPGRLRTGLMSDFAQCEVPFPLPPLTYSLFWHSRTHNSPPHAWVRQELERAAERLK